MVKQLLLIGMKMEMSTF